MKTLVLSSLVLFSTVSSYAAECTKVFKTCVSEVTVSKDLNEFLSLEAEIGKATYDLNHVNQFKIFKADNGYAFTHYGSSSASLTALGKWATKTMGVYDAPEYDAFEMIKSAEKMDAKAFSKFLDDSLSDIKEYQNQVAEGEAEDFTPELKAKVDRYMAIRAQAKKEISNLVKDSNSIVVYELLDNNNENVQDAEFVVVAGDIVILVNRFWWL